MKGVINPMLTWHYVTSKAYKDAGAEEKTSDKLFFLSDTKEIYRGTELFTQAYELYTTTKPTTPAVGRIYIESSTLEGSIYNGSDWVTVIQPVQATLDQADTTKPVSGKAVHDYVTSAIANVTSDSDNAFNGASYNAGANSITFTRNSGTNPVSVEITDLPCDLAYDGDTGLLQLADKDGTPMGTGINLDLERFVKSGEYNPDTEEITLYFDDEKTDSITIDASALVDIYTGGTTSTATVNVSAGNEITATVRVSAESGNQVVAKEDGIFVAAPDMSGLGNKQDKDSDAVAGNLAKFDDSGNAIDAGIVAGGATLSGTPNATTLATEAAVAAIRSALQTAIDGKIAKISGGTTGNIVTVAADGQVADSGKKAGGATLSETPNANTLATEAAVKAATDALSTGKQDKDTDAVQNNLAKFDANGNTVDAGVKAGGSTLAEQANATTMATEAAVVAALEWKTTV